MKNRPKFWIIWLLIRLNLFMWCVGKNGLGVNVCTTRVFFSEFLVKYRPHFSLNIFSFILNWIILRFQLALFTGENHFSRDFTLIFFFIRNFHRRRRLSATDQTSAKCAPFFACECANRLNRQITTDKPTIFPPRR